MKKRYCLHCGNIVRRIMLGNFYNYKFCSQNCRIDYSRALRKRKRDLISSLKKVRKELEDIKGIELTKLS